MVGPGYFSIRPPLSLLLLVVGSEAVQAQPAPAGPSRQAVARHAARRASALERLGARLLLVPSRESFKSDDQAGFKQATDFQYLTGLSELVGAVLVLDGGARESVLFLPRPNPLVARALPKLGVEGAREVGVTDVQPVDSLPGWLAGRFARAPAILVSPNDPRGAVRAPVPMAGGVARWGHWLQSIGYTGNVSSATEVTRRLREIKEADEIATLERVGRASGRAMLAGMRALAPGRRQRLAEAEVVASCIRDGGVHSFWPWAMSGTRGVYTDLFSSFVDYENNDREMRAGELVRVDVGCQLDQYMGDVGRTAPVGGRFSPGQREAWDIFVAGYLAGLATVRDGVGARDVYETARRRIRELEPTLRTDAGRRAVAELLSPRGIEGWQFHNVGLDDAEGGALVLRAGMVVAYELMYALDGEGYYLEDMILVERDGYRNLTAALPYTAGDIERAMARGR